MSSPHTLQVVRRAEQLYRQKWKTALEGSHPGQYVAIEPESQEHFVAPALSEAIRAARLAHPTRISYAIRIGHPAAVHLGVMAT